MKSIVLVAVLLSAPSAEALPFHVETRFSQSLNGSADARFDAPVESSTSATTSNTFSGSLSDLTGSGTTTGAASASGSFGASGLRLGVSSNVSATGTLAPAALTFDYRGQAFAFNQFLDTITLVGGTPGATGYLRGVFGLTGSFDTAVSVNGATAEANLNLARADSLGNIAVVDKSLRTLLGKIQEFQGFPTIFPSTLTLDFQYIFGTPGNFGLTLAANSTAILLETGESVAALNFANTLALLSVEILNAEKEPIAGQVISANDFAYVSPTPEPATLALLGTTLAAMGIAARARRRRQEPTAAD